MGNGRNGGPIVILPEDRQGPNVENPQRAFYVNAPQFHWHQYVVGAADEGARAGIHQIAMEAFAFGQMTERRLRELEARPMMEQWIPEAVAEVRGRIADFGGRLQTQPAAEKFEQLQEEVKQRCDAIVQAQNQFAAEVAQAQEDVQHLRIESRR